jgi:hypothetical protein
MRQSIAQIDQRLDVLAGRFACRKFWLVAQRQSKLEFLDDRLADFPPLMQLVRPDIRKHRCAAHGYEPTCEAAMAAFAKSWRRE